MTAKKGDIVFVTQAHVGQEVAAVVVDRVTNADQVKVHVISSSDPYSVVTVAHRLFADDIGYLEADESEPRQNRPVQPPVDNDHVEAGAELFGFGSGPAVPDTDPTDSGGDSAPDESGDSEDEEESDESEEDESSSEVSEGDEDGEPVPSAGRKRGKGRKR